MSVLFYCPSTCLVLFHRGERLTLIHKDQGELVLGAAVLQLSRVRALVLLAELVKQYLQQTFVLVEVDLTVLQNSKQALAHGQSTAEWQVDTPLAAYCVDG